MQINFTGHNVEVTPALKAFTQEKFTKLERHYDKIISVHVTFDVEKLEQIVEANILVDKGDIFAKAKSDDMYNAIVSLVEKLIRQLEKHKQKHENHRE